MFQLHYFTLHQNIKCCTSLAKCSLGILWIKEVQDNRKFSNISAICPFPVSFLTWSSDVFLTEPNYLKCQALVALCSGLSYGFWLYFQPPSKLQLTCQCLSCLLQHAHQSQILPYELLLTSILKEFCLRPKSVNCLAFPHHHRHSVQHSLCPPPKPGEPPKLWLQHIEPCMKAAHNWWTEVKAPLKPKYFWEIIFVFSYFPMTM